MQLPPCTFQSNFTLQLTCLAKVCKCTTWLCLEKYNQCKCDISMITGNAKKCLEGHFAHFLCPMLQIACGHTDRLHIRLDTQSLLCLLPRSSQNSSWFYIVSWDTWGLVARLTFGSSKSVCCMLWIHLRLCKAEPLVRSPLPANSRGVHKD